MIEDDIHPHPLQVHWLISRWWLWWSIWLRRWLKLLSVNDLFEVHMDSTSSENTEEARFSRYFKITSMWIDHMFICSIQPFFRLVLAHTDTHHWLDWIKMDSRYSRRSNGAGVDWIPRAVGHYFRHSPHSKIHMYGDGSVRINTQQNQPMTPCGRVRSMEEDMENLGIWKMSVLPLVGSPRPMLDNR
jgi:hypothetical protein